jgi:hypothetical protein
VSVMRARCTPAHSHRNPNWRAHLRLRPGAQAPPQVAAAPHPMDPAIVNAPGLASVRRTLRATRRVHAAAGADAHPRTRVSFLRARQGMPPQFYPPYGGPQGGYPRPPQGAPGMWGQPNAYPGAPGMMPQYGAGPAPPQWGGPGYYGMQQMGPPQPMQRARPCRRLRCVRLLRADSSWGWARSLLRACVCALTADARRVCVRSVCPAADGGQAHGRADGGGHAHGAQPAAARSGRAHGTRAGAVQARARSSTHTRHDTCVFPPAPPRSSTDALSPSPRVCGASAALPWQPTCRRRARLRPRCRRRPSLRRRRRPLRPLCARARPATRVQPAQATRRAPRRPARRHLAAARGAARRARAGLRRRRRRLAAAATGGQRRTAARPPPSSFPRRTLTLRPTCRSSTSPPRTPRPRWRRVRTTRMTFSTQCRVTRWTSRAAMSGSATAMMVTGA